MELGHGGPFGAVVVRDGVVVGEGWNEVLRTKAPPAHVEVVAIRNASHKLARRMTCQGARSMPVCERLLGQPARRVLVRPVRSGCGGRRWFG